MTAGRDALLRWAEIDVRALRDNARLIRERLQPPAQLLAMVKSNGYGHDAVFAAGAALKAGATWLGVYTPDEALALRRERLGSRMLVVGWSPPSALPHLLRLDVDVMAYDSAGVRAIARVAREARARARVHLKIDTGLGRLGARPGSLNELRDALRDEASNIEVAGIFTHFADAEGDRQFTHDQHDRFLQASAALRPVAPDALLHTCGSAAILNFPEMHHDLVRLGIAMYGYVPPGVRDATPLRPAMSVFARVAQVKDVAAGESVGYGRTWWAPSARRIATIAMGYGQGLPRALSNRGSVLVRGCRCPIAGIVSMDQITVGVTDAGDVAAGDAVMLFGDSGGHRLGADEVASLVGTIPHEILCGIATSVPRIRVGDGTTAA
ncbi:MAG: alanine racemase [Candidatus Dormibacteria bacterium]